MGGSLILRTPTSNASNFYDSFNTEYNHLYVGYKFGSAASGPDAEYQACEWGLKYSDITISDLQLGNGQISHSIMANSAASLRGKITVNGNGKIHLNTGNNADTRTLTIYSSLAGAGTLTFSQSHAAAPGSTTIDSSNNTFSGTVVNGATLILQGTNAFGSATSFTNNAKITLSTAQKLNNLTGSSTSTITANAALTLDNTTDTAYSGVISGSGTVTKTGTGKLTLTGVNTYSGATTITGGTLALSGNGVLGAGNVGFGSANATLDIGSTSQSIKLTAAGTTPKGIITSSTRNGNLTITGRSGGDCWTTIDLGNGTLTLGSASAGLDAIAFQGNHTFSNLNAYFKASQSLWFYSVASGDAVTGNINNLKEPATLFLAGSALGNTVGINGSITGSFSVTLRNMADKTAIFQKANTYTGSTNVETGTLKLIGDATFGNGNVTNSSQIVFENTNGQEIANIISGTGSVTKSGTGVIALTGANTYFGDTTVSGGELIVNGSIASSPVVVSSGAFLSGIGAIGGKVTINDGGNLNPGNSPGTITFSNGLDMDGIWTEEIAALDSVDKIIVTGDAVFTNTSFLNIALLDGYTPEVNDTFDILTATGAITGYDLISGITSVWDLSLVEGGNALRLTYKGAPVTPVPEPSTWALLILGALGLTYFRRKR